jgi:hypothetical protein
MLVHVLGNSNVGYFIGKPIDGDKVYQEKCGELTIRAFKAGNTGATIHGLNNDESETGARQKFNDYCHYNNPIENLVLVLGDVDARFHLKDDEKNSLDEKLKGLISTLEQYVDNRISLPIKRVILFLPTPFSKDALLDCSRSNPYASLSLSLMREALIDLANKRKEIGWSYLSIYNDLVSDNGFLSSEFVGEDLVHCNYKKVQPIILDKLLKILKEK